MSGYWSRLDCLAHNCIQSTGIPRFSSPSSGRVAEHTDVDLLIPEPAQVQLTADVYKREAVKDAMRYAWGEYGEFDRTFHGALPSE